MERTMTEQSQLSLTTVIGPDDLVLIRSIIDEQLRSHGLIPAAKTRQKPPPKDYTTVHEIRQAIRDNLTAIQETTRGNYFHVSALAYFLLNAIQPKQGDLESLADGKVRFYSQVSRAVDPQHWPDAPIKRASRRGYYIIDQNP